jgi:hypothetical protein
MTDPIQTRIRNHYQAENGEWLVEKGKVKEAKLLKEACEEIEALKRANRKLENEYFEKVRTTYSKERELEKREKLIVKREQRFEDRKASFIREFEKWV